MERKKVDAEIPRQNFVGISLLTFDIQLKQFSWNFSPVSPYFYSRSHILWIRLYLMHFQLHSLLHDNVRLVGSDF